MNEKTNVKDNFISIGKLSKITGVHVQSLRYYERIGILTPAYIDDSTKYRYYAFSQIKLVEAIQYCVELDIPLKEFSMFISKNQKQIDYEKLLQYGHEIAYRKIETIKQKMQFFEEINEDMKHGEMCMDSTPVIARFPSKTYLTIPYDGTQNSNVFHAMVITLLEQIRSNGWQTNYDSGLISIYTKNKAEHFASLEILNSNEQILQCQNVIQVPEMQFICHRKPVSNIQAAPELYREQFAKSYDKVVIERELFTGKFEYTTPYYEIRCALEK